LSAKALGVPGHSQSRLPALDWQRTTAHPKFDMSFWELTFRGPINRMREYPASNAAGATCIQLIAASSKKSSNRLIFKPGMVSS
jgi:hypothetical protein